VQRDSCWKVERLQSQNPTLNHSNFFTSFSQMLMNMITYDQALILAKDYIKPQEVSLRETESDDKLVLGKSVEFDEGWLFYFTSRKYLKTRDLQYRPIGRGPVIVGRENGDVFQGGSGYAEEQWINQFKDYVQFKGN